MPDAGYDHAIAVIGLAGRFPGASTLEQFWTNICAGVDSVSHFSAADLAAAGFDPSLAREPSYVAARGVLDGVELFDAGFFGYTPREAEAMDPQQRLFLECAWEAVERAGYDTERYRGAVGVFAGCGVSTYVSQIHSNPQVARLIGAFQIAIGNDKDHLTTHVSYKLNLTGPSIAVQTACSSSLVAVCTACHALWSYQCDMALAGGSLVHVPQHEGGVYQPGGILSPDGRCRPFDARAAGTVPGNGCGVVLLKRMADAAADGDRVHALIRGVGVNNDGAAKVGYTAPGVDGQAQVIQMAHALAGVDPATIGYVEAHGTATALGDPVEIGALTQAFRARTTRRGFCAVGSVKSNIGHLDPAAGIAGLIKAIMAIEHGVLPPVAHFDAPNPAIDFENSPFYVSRRAAPWPDIGVRRRAGVSSFGIGGTNAHVVLEQAPTPAVPGPSRSTQLLLVSARSPAALNDAARNLARHFAASADDTLPDAAYTLAMGRRQFAHRCAVVARTSADATAAFRGDGELRAIHGAAGTNAPGVLLMFPGQGAQAFGMGRELYEREEIFRVELDRCVVTLDQMGVQLRPLLGLAAGVHGDPAAALDETVNAQPALFAVEYAVARTLLRWGIRPVALLGHSIGEYVAATLAGVFTLEDALNAVAIRGRLMHAQPRGAMLAVQLSETDARARLSGTLSLAAVNGPESVVVSGSFDDVASLDAALGLEGVACRRVRTSHAFHSAMMDAVLEPFAKALAEVDLSPPTLPVLSNITGTWLTPGEATDRAYWTRHLRETVRFSDGLREAHARGATAFVEAGPGRTLGRLIASHRLGSRDQVIVGTMTGTEAGTGEQHALLSSLARLWVSGTEVDWSSFYTGERRVRVALPTYPFQRSRYWVDPAPASPAAVAASAAPERHDANRWFYFPSWRRMPLQAASTQAGDWLVFADADSGAAVVAEAVSRGHRVVLVQPGARFDRSPGGHYVVDPERASDYTALLRDLRGRGRLPGRIVHMWSATPPAEADEDAAYEPEVARGVLSLMCLVQSLVREHADHVDVCTVTSGVYDVTGDERLVPARAMLPGLGRVIPQEHPQFTCRHVDVPGDAGAVASFIPALVRELETLPRERTVALRGPHRWVQVFEPHAPQDQPSPVFRPGGVYLITGGLGRIGLAIARRIAARVPCTLVLASRQAFPPRSQWNSLVEPTGSGLVTERVRSIQAIEGAGAVVRVARCDVAEPADVRRLLDEIEAECGELSGVVHAAGVLTGSGFAPLVRLTPDACRDVFRGKVLGLRALEWALRDRRLDFCMLMSSLSSVLGGLGFGAYAAANAFLDASAARHRNGRHQRWVSVNWDGWAFDEEVDQPRASSESQQHAIHVTEGLDAFERLAAGGECQVAVSTTDLRSRIERWVVLASLSEPSHDTPAERRHDRPALEEQYAEPRSERERVIAEIWQGLLGIDRIGVRDDFFELGGHSLLAIQLVSRLRDAFRVEIPVGVIFDAPTVVGLSEYVEQDLARGDAQEISRTLSVVEALSDAEVAALLPRAAGDGSAAGAPVGVQPMPAQVFYDAVNNQLAASDAGAHALFLNYGYLDGDDLPESPVQLPPRCLNRESIRLVLELIGREDLCGCRVLDVGSGRGGTLWVLAKYFETAKRVGIDVSSAAVRFSTRAVGRDGTDFLQADAERLPFPASTFDVVTNVESSHGYGDRFAFFSEVCRVLAPRGRFLYTDLLPQEDWDSALAHLAALGFRIERVRDVTANVLRSCAAISPLRAGAFGPGSNAVAMAEFLAAPGSRIFEEMRSGAARYCIVRAHKPAPAPSDD